MASGHHRDGVENIDNFPDESTVDAAGDAFTATVQKCSAHIRSHEHHPEGGGAQCRSGLERDRSRCHHRHCGGHPRPDGTEQRIEGNVVHLHGEQRQRQHHPHDQHHRATGASVDVWVPVTTALPVSVSEASVDGVSLDTENLSSLVESAEPMIPASQALRAPSGNDPVSRVKYCAVR